MRRIAVAGAAAVLAAMAGALQAQELLSPQPSAEERDVHIVLALALASFAFSLFAAVRLKPRDVPAGIASVGAGLAVVASVVAFAALYLLVRPKTGYEGLIAFVVLYYGAVPFVLVVLGLWASVVNHNATRLRVFAAWLGTLTAASILAMFFVSFPH